MGKLTFFIVSLVSLFFVSTSYLSANTVTSFAMQTAADAEKEIELKKYTVKGNIRSSSYIPFRAMQSSLFISVDILAPVGVFTVEVVNDGGVMIYQATLDTSMQNEFLIDISDWYAGSYSIAFVMGEGQCVFGEFEVE